MRIGYIFAKSGLESAFIKCGFKYFFTDLNFRVELNMNMDMDMNINNLYIKS
jgi:hypothetical protein